MDDLLATTMMISGLGIVLLFLALALLSGLMYLMTALIKDRPTSQPVEPPPSEETDLLQQAAAIAVALARAEQEAIVIPPETETPPSGWRSYHHHRQLVHSHPTRRNP